MVEQLMRDVLCEHHTKNMKRDLKEKVTPISVHPSYMRGIQAESIEWYETEVTWLILRKRNRSTYKFYYMNMYPTSIDWSGKERMRWSYLPPSAEENYFIHKGHATHSHIFEFLVSANKQAEAQLFWST